MTGSDNQYKYSVGKCYFGLVKVDRRYMRGELNFESNKRFG